MVDQSRRPSVPVARQPAPAETPVAWTFRAVWPVDDPEIGSRTALSRAAADLPTLAEASNARLLADPEWTVEEVEDPQRWPFAVCVVVAVAPAVPARPSSQQWLAVLSHLFALDWTDRRIADLLGIPETLVAALYGLLQPNAARDQRRWAA